ncbi:hypothetical protein K847_06402 [Mycobacterium tuberculosis TKK-01-0018]|nr:hypothetical protein K847_06402 [Mycobacterium tuberculosis TKK-01-0018]
MIPHSPAAG